MNVNIAPDFAGLWDALDADTLAILEENNLADPKHERLPAVPVWTNGPKPNIILDCHHTHSIRKRHRLTIRYSKLEFPHRDAAMDYARRIQLGRRNLTESQMALAVAEWKKNRRKQGQPAENRLNSTISLDGMAKVAGVGRSTMIAATKVADKSPPQIVKAVAAGEVKVSDAVAVLELSPKEQLAALAAKRKGKVKTLRGAAFDPEQLEKQPARQQTPKKSGKPVITKENRTDAQKHLGGLIRALKALDIYDEFVQALSAIATRLKKI